MDSKKIFGVIPARLNSSRLPQKLLRKIHGKTLLERTFEQAKSYSKLDKIFIATDHLSIAQHAEQDLGCEVILTSSNISSGTERIVEAFHNHPELNEADIILNIQGDHPLISNQTVEQLLQTFEEDPIAEVVTAAVLCNDPNQRLLPQIVKCVIDQNGYALYFSRTPIPYSETKENVSFYHHLGIYAYRNRFLKKFHSFTPSLLEQTEKLEQLRFLENRVPMKVCIVQDNPIGVDTYEDLKKYEEALCT